MNMQLIGKSVVKPDAIDKVTGKALYAGDLKRKGMFFAKAVRSPYAHARILSIDPTPALAVQGVKGVLTAQDIPGDNHVGMTANKDQVVLADKKVRFLGEAVAVVVAESKAAALKGVSKVVVDYEKLPVVASPVQGLSEDSVLVSDKGNLCWHKKVVRGDWENALKNAAVVVTGEYRTPRVEHAYLEPEAVLAEPDGEGILVWSSTKSVHLDRKEIARVLNLPLEKVNVVAPHIGGSFGGKSDLTLNCMAALACVKTGKPVLMVQEREESFQVSTKRHACIIKYTHAADAQGHLLGVKLDLVADAGAYIDYTSPTMQRMIVHGAGPYKVPNVWIEGRGVLTNNTISGAMRGFGVPQIVFACERQMDLLAEKLNMDPIELRLKNVLNRGDNFITGQMVDHATGLKEGLLKAGEIIRDSNDSSNSAEKTAWGLACYYYGNGRTGQADPGVATVELLEDGKVQLSFGSPDIGQGSNTIMAQILVETLRLGMDQIRLVSADTRCTLDSGTTSGTRLTAIVGKAVQEAAETWRERIIEIAANLMNVSAQGLRLESGDEEARVVGPEREMRFKEIYQRAKADNIDMSVTVKYEPPTTALDENGQGKPYDAYTYGVQLANVAVNQYTGKVDVKKLINIVNVGQVINPALLEGQIEGGAVMGIGYALLEELKLKEGEVLNPNFSSYLIPTSCDSAEIEHIALPMTDQRGPYGAVGIGEPATIPVAAAIANGVSRAMEISFTKLPLSLEDIVLKTGIA